jgi:hypothetical protein
LEDIKIKTYYTNLENVHFVDLYCIIGRVARQVCCLSPMPFNLCNEYGIRKAVEGFVVFKIGGQVIYNVKYTDDLVLLAKEEMVLQDMVDRLVEMGRDGTEWK